MFFRALRPRVGTPDLCALDEHFDGESAPGHLKEIVRQERVAAADALSSLKSVESTDPDGPLPVEGQPAK